MVATPIDIINLVVSFLKLCPLNVTFLQYLGIRQRKESGYSNDVYTLASLPFMLLTLTEKNESLYQSHSIF